MTKKVRPQDSFERYAVLPSPVLYFERSAGGDEMEVRLNGGVITQVGHDFVKGTRLSPKALRERFLAVRSFEEAVTFAQICGPFLELQPGMSTQQIDWALFLEWQSFTKSLMLASNPGSTTWPKTNRKSPVGQQAHDFTWFTEPELHQRTDDGELYFRFYCSTAMEVVGASIAADKMLGIEFRSCPLCGKVFEAAIHGGHEKLYCTPDHSRRAAKLRAKEGRDAEVQA